MVYKLPTERISKDIHEKIMKIKEKRGFKSFDTTLRFLLNNLNPEDIPEVGACEIEVGIVLGSKPFIKKKRILKVNE